MLVPLSWLKEYVDIDVTPEELEKKLALVTKRLEQQRQVVTEASQEVKKLERLKEHQLEEYRRAEAKEQQESILEHVAGEFVKRAGS